MTDLPKPPQWPRTSVTVSEEAQDALASIKTTAFFADSRMDAVEEAMETFTMAGQGTGRIVVTGGPLPNGVVAKVAINQRGFNGNQEERYTREKYPDITPYLPPILAHESSDWIVMEKCETPAKDAVEPLKGILDDSDVSYHTVELAKTNVGFYNGAPCIVDWDTLFG